MTEGELIESLLEEIRKRDSGPSDARTSTEWGPMFGLVDLDSIGKRIKRLMASGHMERCVVRRENMAGVNAPVVAYRLKVTP